MNLVRVSILMSLSIIINYIFNFLNTFNLIMYITETYTSLCIIMKLNNRNQNFINSFLKGMKCNLCTKHQRRPKKCVPGKAAWVDLPCSWMVRESILRHGRSETHKEAVAFEGARVLANTSLATAVEKEVTLNEMAMESAMKCLYWLCKRELPHTTNYVPLMNLCKFDFQYL